MKTPLGRPGDKCEDIFEMDLRENGDDEV